MSGVGGVAGGIGIPDIVALVVLVAGFLWIRRNAPVSPDGWLWIHCLRWHDVHLAGLSP